MSAPEFTNHYSELPSAFFEKTAPAKVPAPELIRLNEGLADSLGLDLDWLQSKAGLNMMSGNELPDNSTSIAMAYAGHQFAGWSPKLGDGRALLLGEVVAKDGLSYDIQLKGSGKTPFSRRGDGKAALGPVLREYIVSEAMFHLGVPTTRALACVSTGEKVQRETALPGAILTRIARSHVRVGTFQYFYARGDHEALRTLATHVIERNYPELVNDASPFASLLAAIVEKQAKLIAQWMGFGFIHGVMNTDNMQIAGETIDFGPCAFMEVFHPKCVFSSIDRDGRYSWVKQPEMAQWNLSRLAECFLPLLADTEDAAMPIAQDALGRFDQIFNTALMQIFCDKLGLSGDPSKHTEFVEATFAMLAKNTLDFTQFFRRLTQIARGDSIELFEDPTARDEWLAQWQSATKSKPDAKRMAQVNPIFIPRNHRVEEAIQSGLQGDYTAFHRLTEVLQNPFQEQPVHAALEWPAQPEETVHATFCGT